MFDSMLKDVVVNFSDDTLILKIGDAKKRFIVAGKISLKLPYSQQFTFDGANLVYHANAKNILLSNIEEQFKKMLEEKE